MGKIRIVGLGAGDPKKLTLSVMEALSSGAPIYVRTKEHPTIDVFETFGFQYTSFDSYYEEEETFDRVYERIVSTLSEVSAKEDIIYAVPGHPLVAEDTVHMLLARGRGVEIIDGKSFIDEVFMALEVDPIEGFMLLDGLNLHVEDLNPRLHTLLTQLYDGFTLSEAKLTLMEVYDAECEVVKISKAGTVDCTCVRLPLYELDYEYGVDNLLTVYVPKQDR